MEPINTNEAGLNQENKLKKNIPILITLSLAGAFVYALPYFRLFYYDAFIEVFQMTNMEAGLCGTFYGALAALSYLVGGFIADKVPVRTLLVISLLTTGVVGLFLLTMPSPFIVAVIHGIWGVTTIMTFWPAMMKALRALAASNEQGKVFGFWEGGRGIVNTVYLSVAVGAFAYLTAKGGTVLGIKGLILAYSIIAIVLGILLLFLLKKDTQEREKSNAFDFKIVGQVLKMPETWLMVGIIFCTYTMNLSYYYIAPYATEVFGITTVFAAALATMSQYMRPLAGFGGGFLADRVNASKVMVTGQVLMIIGIGIILLTPGSASMMFILLACVFVYASMYVCQSMHFAIMEETNFSENSVGTAIGIICCLGYLPESLCPLVAGILLDKFSGESGYRYYFILLLIVSVIGLGLTTVWLKRTKEKRKEILQLNKK